jgi:hypothetical protein
MVILLGGLMRHYSDCAVHNGPALPVGECDCSDTVILDGAWLRAEVRDALRSIRRLFPIALALTIIALALSGCQTTRYVTVPCLTKDQTLPAEPDRVKDRLTGKADEDVRIIAGSNIRLRAWGSGLRDILEGCRG